MKRRLKSAGLWLLVLALAAGSMALPWMVCEAYDRELFAQPRTRPATDLALSAAARENGFVSQLYERQNLLGGWSEGWEPLAEEEADTAAENARETLLELMTLGNLPDGARQTVGEALTQSSRGQAWRDEMGFVRVRLGDVYLITEPVTGLPARLSIYGSVDAPADPMALLEEWRAKLGVDVLPDWEETETVQAGATELRSAQGRLRLQVCAAHETFLLEAASFS
ncbi:MAG TPA: hypothetical protein H9813_03440 [Candidatus Fournierella merdipullorum]|uniref:Uncharacterized protein n=1 Tax=Candidatus Allofournierella merdipullorum TaxID=2838595 RepID=A0A9D2IYF2_9FIRM|nr:hypothetical protein [Candidatus Fournierella merdipullorum]